MNNKEIFNLWKSSDRSISFKQFKLEYQLENGIEIEEPLEQESITPVTTSSPISNTQDQQPTGERKVKVLRFRTSIKQMRQLEDYGYYNKIPSISETIYNIIAIFFKERGI